MGPVAVLFGALLMGLGVGFFFGTGADHFTSLIPAFFGVVLAVLGLLARQDRLRKHVMHAAAAIALVGFIIPLVMVILGISSGQPKPSKIGEQGTMAFLCLVFVLLCVRSFIEARRSRARAEVERAPLESKAGQ